MNKFLLNTNGTNKYGIIKSYLGKPITETLTNGFFTIDKQWTVIYWNKAAEKIFGISAKNIVGENLWQKLADILPLEFYNIYDKAFREDGPIHFEEYWGEMAAWFDVVTYYCNNILSVSFKSSKHPHAEYPESPIQRLNTLTELYKFVTEITNDCLWEWNLQLNEIFWIDGGHKRVFGYPFENVLIPEVFWENCIHPDDRSRVLKKLKEIISTGTINIWTDKYRFKKSNGDYAYVHDRGHIIYDDKIPTRIICATQDITEKTFLENELTRERHGKQKEITNAVLTALENERANIEDELQENLGQMLAAAKMYLEMSKTSEKNRQLYVGKSIDFIVNVMGEIRRISKTLSAPGILIGLFSAIENLLEDIFLVQHIKIEFQEEGITESDMNEKLQINIFRIVQEQLNNILKHANATKASISLSKVANNVILFIRDNGVGHDTSLEIKGVGIINIRSRAELYGGTATIISKSGKGFELKVILPLQENDR